MTDNICGAECTDGTPCRHPAGSCPVPSHSPKRGDGGRPSKFNDERRESILSAARNGTTVEGCARAAGIGTSTLYDWLDQYPEFSESFNRARAKAEQDLVEAAKEDDPKWVLERSYGYVKTEKREVEMDANHNFDASEGVTAEFVSYEEDTDGDT